MTECTGANDGTCPKHPEVNLDETSSRGDSGLCPRCGIPLDDPDHQVLPDGCRSRASFPRGASASRGESPTRGESDAQLDERAYLVGWLAQAGHGGHASDLAAAKSGSESATVAYHIADHVLDDPGNEMPALADRLRRWGDNQEVGE